MSEFDFNLENKNNLFNQKFLSIENLIIINIISFITKIFNLFTWNFLIKNIINIWHFITNKASHNEEKLFDLNFFTHRPV